MNNLTPEFWSDRYQQKQTGWDLGQISPPLKAYFDQLEDKELKILIPGCGRGYEGVYLWKNGFKNVYFADFTVEAIQAVKGKIPDIPDNQLICQDFFTMDASFDLIIEQTMFCAIDPTLRPEYVKQAAKMLNPNGKLIGVLFNREFEGGPPFGGSKIEYQTLFKEQFRTISIEECYNSIEPRNGAEVFIKVKK